MIMIDGKEYVEVEKVKQNFVDREALIAEINKLIDNLGLITTPAPEPPQPKKGFFRK